MSNATEQSIKEKLKTISKERLIPFNTLLETLFLERFLVRIGKSSYADKLIFKGGMCLANYIDLGRETKDIDFLLTQVSGSKDALVDAIKEISNTDIGDDFVFSNPELSELSIEHKKHPGYQISLQGELGQIRNKISIDIGIGDIVRPRLLEVELLKSSKPLFEETISLNSYPPEYIFSEKIEAILHLVDSNSRMKDFYDCYQLVKGRALDKSLAGDALQETCKNRGTKLTLISEETDIFNSLWKNFIKKSKSPDLMISDVVKTINSFLKKTI